MTNPKRVCIVGSGPSGNASASIVDAWPFVVRIRDFHRVCGRNAGSRTDAVAWAGNVGPWATPPSQLDGGTVEHWFTLAPSLCNPPNPTTPGRWRKVIGRAHGAPLRFLRQCIWDDIEAYLASISPEGRECAPSTGIRCIGLAIDFGVKEIGLVGFDSPGKGLPGDTVATGAPLPKSPHDYVAEKIAIAELVDQQLWLGKPCGVRAHWYRRSYPLLLSGGQQHA